MRKLFAGFLLLIVSGLSAQQAQIELLKGQSAQLDFLDYELYGLKLKNNSSAEIKVSIISRITEKQLRGFGLSPKATVQEVVVESDSYALFKNLSDSTATFLVEASPKTNESVSVKDGVGFTLRNTTLKSIPLIIPSVMNPNLSPKSNSRVYLRYGQQVFLNKGMNRKLLLTVDETILEGAIIDVDSIIRLRDNE
jgi:hypothetical protein